MTATPSEVFTEPAPDFRHDTLRAALREHWSITAPGLRPLDSERDLNVLVDGKYVLKISNPAEDRDVVAMEVAALAHVHATDPGLPVPATVGQTVVIQDDHGRDCLARLVTLLPGAPLEGSRIDPALATQIGAVAGRTSVALQGFFHRAADRRLLWDIRGLPEMDVPEGHLTTLADRVRPALAATSALPSGIQHADVTLTNILAEKATVVGVIDFGDMHHTAAVCDLAATLASVLRSVQGGLDEIWLLSEAVLRGYQHHRLLSTAEVSVLGELVIARLVTTLAVSAARRDRHSENRRYITQYDDNSSRVLDLLGALAPDQIADRLHRSAGSRRLANPLPDLADRRAAVMGGRLSPLFYSEPLEIVRGEGPWLFAADGARYLDAYNNVAVLGHAHPAVTNAVGTQLADLNTHSRYLHPAIVELAERIVATMPSSLDTCLFTTSGTEANELAWRMATEYTGGSGAIVAEHAYHGSSKWMADLSSNEWPPGYRPERVATFQAGRSGTVELAAQQLRAQGHRPALVLADSQFTSEGILDVSAEFSAGLVEETHRAGALYLADEVQSGYGRSGPRLWRFLLAGITPDFVTLGKPMGAGYPIGAVITRREIADALASRYEYFSTFAATPAAAAAGHAVLDVLELTGLPAQAVQVGAYLRQQLTKVVAESPLLGSVRGTGLLAGVDVLGDRASTRSLLDRLAAQRVLAGATGPAGNVLKIRPPLVWNNEHVDEFITKLVLAMS